MKLRSLLALLLVPVAANAFAPAFSLSAQLNNIHSAKIKCRLRTAAAPVATATLPERTAVSASLPLAYEFVYGADSADEKDTPTCVLVHGILGSRRNLVSFAKRLADAFPRWRFMLVDLRCHGESSGRTSAGDHSVESAAQDVIDLCRALGIYPIMLMGHSFGGKVAMQMIQMAGRILPRPVQVWVLDTVPGDAWLRDGGDHPRDTIEFVRTLPVPFDSRKSLVDSLTSAGFTVEGAQLMATNLKPVEKGSRELTWTFDISGIVELYASYERCDLWPMLETRAKNCHLDFVRAERSAFVWRDDDVQRIGDAGAGVHMLSDSSHWVHIDNPDGLLQILAPSFSAMER